MKLCLRFLILIAFFSSCSALKTKDSEAEVREFLAAFQKALPGDEKTVLGFFDTPQSRESLLSAVAVLRNQESQFIQCEAAIQSAVIEFQEERVRVTIPVVFTSRNTETDYKQETTLAMWLKPRKNSYVITELIADKFYEKFASMKNEMQWEVQREQAFLDREGFYATAKTLEQKYDSVIWYTVYDKQPYYYVVQGSWNNYFRSYKKGTNTDVLMGVVNSAGETIIPQEFDLIGTLGFSFTGIAEVMKNGKSGYYDFERKELIVPAAYDIIIPYGRQNVLCVVKNEGIYGFYNYAHQYQEGFPSEEVKRWVEDFMFIPEKMQIKSGKQALCEIPSKDHAGYGIIISPSYLVKTGIFKQYIAGITATDFPLEGWTDYVETEGTVSTRITESLVALVTTIRERYLEGREEFYEHNKIVFVGPTHDTLNVADFPAGGEVTLRKIENIIEVKYSTPADYYYEQSFWPDIVPGYSYFKVGEDLAISALSTNRSFPQTQFVKLDSSYFTGRFTHSKTINENGEEKWVEEETSFISQATIRYMLDEMLASHGVRVLNNDNNNFDIFNNVPEVSSQQAMEAMSDVERHNVALLTVLLGEAVPENI